MTMRHRRANEEVCCTDEGRIANVVNIRCRYIFCCSCRINFSPSSDYSYILLSVQVLGERGRHGWREGQGV
jgi:hypothetical protein